MIKLSPLMFEHIRVTLLVGFNGTIKTPIPQTSKSADESLIRHVCEIDRRFVVETYERMADRASSRLSILDILDDLNNPKRFLEIFADKWLDPTRPLYVSSTVVAGITSGYRAELWDRAVLGSEPLPMSLVQQTV